jgi:hypothetical protein
MKMSFRHGKLIVAAVAQIIWSTLDDTSTCVPLTDRPLSTISAVSLPNNSIAPGPKLGGRRLSVKWVARQ